MDMLVYGKNVIREAVFQGRPIRSLKVDRKFSDHRFLSFLRDKGVSWTEVSKEELSRLAGTPSHQGIVADVKDYRVRSLEEVLEGNRNPRLVILDGIEDPHNLGAVLRTAEAAGYDGVVVQKTNRAPLSATVAKVSSGAIEHVPVIEVTNIGTAILSMRDRGILVVGTDGAATTTYDEVWSDTGLAIVLGNEGEGIRPLVKKRCDVLVRIPMKGKINSLNVSVAAALMMYQTMRD
jgi:23S rRNA (guanosine2251-2'-O)-methyltransferase